MKYAAVDEGNGDWMVGEAANELLVARFYGLNAKASAIEWAETITNREPTIPLPEEPGYYMDANSQLWELAQDSGWRSPPGGRLYERAIVAECAPLSRLFTEGDIEVVASAAVAAATGDGFA
jgi:hypothetical protein